MSVKRYSVNNPKHIHEPDDNGPCVAYTDYAELEIDRDEWKARAEYVRDSVDVYRERDALKARVRELEGALKAREAVLDENVNGWEMDARVVEAGPYTPSADGKEMK